jgi:hypothetical protein
MVLISSRLLVGLAVQPVLAAAVAFVLFPVVMLDGDGRTLAGGYPSDPTDAALSMAAGVAIVATAVTFVGVLPTALWLTKGRQPSLADSLLFGLAFGMVTYVVLLLVLAGGRTYGLPGLLRGLLCSCAIAVTGAAVFWVIALRPRRQPDGS